MVAQEEDTTQDKDNHKDDESENIDQAVKALIRQSYDAGNGATWAWLYMKRILQELACRPR